MKKYFLYSILAIVACRQLVNAQQGSTIIRGIITDSKQKPVEAATVSIIHSKDSSILFQSLSEKNGKFEFTKVIPGEYIVTVSSVGFTLFHTKRFKIVDANNLTTLDTIRLDISPASLAEVTVLDKRPMIEYKPDRTIINVDASLTNVGANALEVLEKSPGISIDKDGNISLKGKQGVMIMIDGKPSYLSGADLTSFLTNMNANQLDQIEIMTNPPAKYDAAGNSGVINIKTKKNKARGFNGNLTLAYGQGRYWKTNNSLNLNYRDQSFNLFLNYSMGSGAGYTDLHILRKYLNPDQKTVNAYFEEPTYLTSHYTNNTLKLGMDYYLSKKTTIGFVASGFISPRRVSGTSTGLLQDANQHTDSTAYTTNSENSRWLNGSLNLNFHQQLDSVSDISMDGDYIRYNSSDAQYFVNSSYYPDGTITGQEQLQGDLPSVINIYSFKTDYSKSLKKKWKLDAGLKTSLVKTNNVSDYSDLENNIWQPDYEKTNHFIYQENINAVYINVNKQINKWNVQTGLRFENTNYKGHQLGNPLKQDSSFSHQYNDLFPTVFISYDINKNNQFTIAAGRRIDRPAYRDLNPFIFYINKYTYQEGNPFLLPQYTGNIELSHIYKGILTTSINYSQTNDYFTDIFRTEGDTTILAQGNLATFRSTGVSMNVQLNINTWWSVNLFANFIYKTVNGFANNSPIKSEGVNGQFNANNQFRFKKGWAAELSGFYNTKDVEGQFITNPFGQVSTGLSKQVFQNKATLKLNIRDMFFTQVIYGDIEYQNVREHYIQSRDSRVVNISFTYRFGKPLKEQAKKNNSSASEEQNRVKAG